LLVLDQLAKFDLVSLKAAQLLVLLVELLLADFNVSLHTPRLLLVLVDNFTSMHAADHLLLGLDLLLNLAVELPLLDLELLDLG